MSTTIPTSTDRLRAVLPDVTVVENRKQRGLSGGKDTGVEVTSSDVVAFLDDDAVAHPDWLGHFRDAYTDERIVGVGGTTLPLWAVGSASVVPGRVRLGAGLYVHW